MRAKGLGACAPFSDKTSTGHFTLREICKANFLPIQVPLFYLYNKKSARHKPNGSCRTDLVRIKGLASLEPPAKQSTGLFFRFQRTRKQVCWLLIQVPLPFYYNKKSVSPKPNGSCWTDLVRIKGLEPPRSPTRS